MAGINTAADAAARARLYLERAELGIVLNRVFAFYPGEATIPNSFTGNLVLGASGDGPGANLIDGVGPPTRIVEPCEEIVIEEIICQLGEEDILHITVTYNPLPDDIYVVFNTSTGQTLAPLTVNEFMGQVDLTFDLSSPPADAGPWSFKIMRAANPEVCFYVKPNCHVVVNVACVLTIDGWVGDGIFPPGPPLFPGDLGLSVTVTGSGFTFGPLSVRLQNGFPPFNFLDITLVTVADDNTLTIDFDATDGGPPAPTGFYGVRISVIGEVPPCEDEFGFEIGDPQIAILVA